MKNFALKTLKYCFVILAPEHSKNLINITYNSINYHYPDSSSITVIDSKATKEETAEIKEICPVYKGKDTITSLINVGMRHAPSDWVFLIFSGTIVRQRLNEKFSFYIGSEKDILFPVANRKYNFIDGTLNGLFINKKTFKEVGEMNDEGSLEFVKAEWAMSAIEYGCKFKAIIGSKMC